MNKSSNLGLLTFEFLNKKHLNIPSWYISFRFLSTLFAQLIYVILFVNTIYPNTKIRDLELDFNKTQAKVNLECGRDMVNTVQSFKYKI